MLLRFEIIWTRIGQVIKLRKVINFYEKNPVYLISNLLKHPVYNVPQNFKLKLKFWIISLFVWNKCINSCDFFLKVGHFIFPIEKHWILKFNGIFIIEIFRRH